MTIEWEDSFNLGIADIDAQHQYFFRLIKALGNTPKVVVGKQNINAHLLTEISRHSLYHFACEEELMMAYNYSGFSDHQKKHRELVEELRRKVEPIIAGNKSISKLRLFLYNWFTNHCTLDDKEYASHILSIRNKVFPVL